LCGWLQERPDSGGTCNWEEAVSGRGLPNLWRFLGEVEGLRDSPSAEAAIAASSDRSPQIMSAADDPANPRSQATARLFCLLLAQEAGNAALRTLTTGGVVLAGGVPPRVLPWLREPAVVQAFRTNDRLSGLLARIPLMVATNDRAAVLGAVAGAVRRFGW
jgi:glucokinase